MAERLVVEVPGGQVPVLFEVGSQATAVVLAHGAGSHMEHKTMDWLDDIVRESGASVVRFNFLYRAMGKGIPDRMPILVATYLAVIDQVRSRLPQARLVIGGHSMGGRVASMLEAESPTADGLLLFGYPLHPPGKLEKLRDAHLGGIRCPVLQFNGTEDEFCHRDLMEDALERNQPAKWALHWVEGANHSYSVRKSSGNTRSDAREAMAETIKGWLSDLG